MEQMLAKPFTEIDYTNPDELVILLYCCVLTNNPVLFPFEEFKVVTENEKQLSAMLKEIEKANLVLGQFTQKNNTQKSNTQGEGGEVQYIKDLAGMLVMAGMDAHYVMNEMEISDIPLFLEAYEKLRREEMEASRLWTFLSVAPHIDTKKIRSARDLMLFPWEVADAKRDAEEVLLRDRETAERFFKEGMNMFKK